MNILVTAGNTLVPIDRVRGITNIFTGRTGTRIGLHAHTCGHSVTLLTSHPEIVSGLSATGSVPEDRWTLHVYHTFDDLNAAMERMLQRHAFHALIHSAAVS